MQVRFPWKSAYAIGDAYIDDEHRQLLELANLLWEAIDCDRAADVVEAASRALAHYAATHFAHEDAYFRRLGSALSHAHHDEHERLTAEFVALYQGDANPETSMAERLQRWVEKRLLPHMMEGDQEALQAARRNDTADASEA